jgi:ectoine hydroxylase-related dioxygenase (phytanoyl-CoA dioxygenase family)
MNSISKKNEFHEKGYIHIGGEIADEVAGFENEVSTLIKNYCKKIGYIPKDENYFQDGIKRLDRINHAFIHQIYNTIRFSDSIAKLTCSETIRHNVKEVLGLSESDPLFVMYSVCRIDPPDDEKFTLDWHQESFSSLRNVPSAQLWAPVVARNDKSNGSIDVLEYSPRHGELDHHLIDNDEYLSLSIKDTSIRDIEKRCRRETIELDPGSAILFHPHLVHKSNHNYSENVRYTVVAHYMDPLNENFEFKAYDELIRDNRRRAKNYSSFQHTIENSKQINF